MKTLTVAEAAETLPSVLEELERDQEEVTLMRDNQTIARIIPEPARANALVVFGDLYGILNDASGEALSKAVGESRKGKKAKLRTLRNPWVS